MKIKDIDPERCRVRSPSILDKMIKKVEDDDEESE